MTTETDTKGRQFVVPLIGDVDWNTLDLKEYKQIKGRSPYRGRGLKYLTAYGVYRGSTVVPLIGEVDWNNKQKREFIHSLFDSVGTLIWSIVRNNN